MGVFFVWVVLEGRAFSCHFFFCTVALEWSYNAYIENVEKVVFFLRWKMQFDQISLASSRYKPSKHRLIVFIVHDNHSLQFMPNKISWYKRLLNRGKIQECEVSRKEEQEQNTHGPPISTIRTDGQLTKKWMLVSHHGKISEYHEFGSSLFHHFGGHYWWVKLCSVDSKSPSNSQTLE